PAASFRRRGKRRDPGRDGAPGAVRRGTRDRRDGAAGPCAVHGRRGAGAEGPGWLGPGPGRRDDGAARNRPAPAAGRDGAAAAGGDAGGADGGQRRRPGLRAERGGIAAAPAAPDRSGRGRRFHGPQHLRDRGGAHGDDAADVVAAGGGGDDLADRGRDRDHEHHAGVGDRAHPRDRAADGGRRGAVGRAPAVPGGGDADLADRGSDRDRAGGGGGAGGGQDRGAAGAAQRAGDRAGGGVLDRDRAVLRLLPGAQGVAA